MFLFSLVIAVPILLFFVVPLTLANYDDINQVRVSCVVKKARVSMNSTQSLRGIGSSKQQVLVETTNCGTLLANGGIDGRGVREIASDLQPQHRYQFAIGAASYKIRKGLALVHVYPNLYSYASR